MVSGLAGLHHLKVYETDIVDNGSPIGTAGLAKLTLWKVALRAFIQTARVRVGA